MRLAADLITPPLTWQRAGPPSLYMGHPTEDGAQGEAEAGDEG